MKNKIPRTDGEASEMETEMKPNALGAPRMELLGTRGADQPRLGATFLEPEQFAPPFGAYDDTDDGFADEEEDELDDEEDEFEEDDEEDEDDEFDDEDDEDEDDEGEEFEDEEEVAGDEDEELDDAEDED